VLRGEATPNYFLDPRVPERVAAAAPQAKLILLLRDPLQRAISWLEHLRRHEGLQGHTETLLLEELEQLQGCPDILSGLVPPPPGPQALQGSCYGQPLERWREACGSRLLVLRSEALFHEPDATLARCTRFLGVSPEWERPRLQAQNVNPQPQPVISPAATEHLLAFLKPLNTGLCQDNPTAGPPEPGNP
jgi:hypothetical protein